MRVKGWRKRLPLTAAFLAIVILLQVFATWFIRDGSAWLLLPGYVAAGLAWDAAGAMVRALRGEL